MALNDNNERTPTPDERAGMNWWNSLSERERAKWLAEAGSAKPVDAWEAYKRAGQPGRGGH
jgi:hypothetical protein